MQVTEIVLRYWVEKMGHLIQIVSSGVVAMGRQRGVRRWKVGDDLGEMLVIQVWHNRSLISGLGSSGAWMTLAQGVVKMGRGKVVLLMDEVLWVKGY